LSGLAVGGTPDIAPPEGELQTRPFGGAEGLFLTQVNGDVPTYPVGRWGFSCATGEFTQGFPSPADGTSAPTSQDFMMKPQPFAARKPLDPDAGKSGLEEVAVIAIVLILFIFLLFCRRRSDSHVHTEKENGVCPSMENDSFNEVEPAQEYRNVLSNDLDDQPPNTLEHKVEDFRVCNSAD
jgi:hypothetical protein